MMAWMNAESFAETVRTGRAVYYSRSRGKLWRKGEESGHLQTVRGIYIDCDADTILLKVEQLGAACHEGYRSCFFREVTPAGVKVVAERLVQPETVYQKVVPTQKTPSPPVAYATVASAKGVIAEAGQPDEWTLLKRTCLSLGYFGFVTLLISVGIPAYSAIPLILLGIAGLMILALLAGIYWTAPSGKKRQVNLLTIFVLTAACAMLLATVTGLIRAHGRTAGNMSLPELIVTFVGAACLFFFSFPFAGYLAETFIWSAAGLVRIPKVRAVVRRLIP
jgi:phosphoribosyl-AMP cyclohydrolase